MNPNPRTHQAWRPVLVTAVAILWHFAGEPPMLAGFILAGINGPR